MEARGLPVWKLTIEYEGTRYRGWQEQKNARTVAGEIRLAAESCLGHQVELGGAGRTDAGVHALGQVAKLKSRTEMAALDLMRSLNDNLPPDINILKTEKTRPAFDPRRDAKARYYLYQISTRRTAFAKRFVWWVRDGLDIDLMNRACLWVSGRRDFRQFCEMRDDERSTIVEVKDTAIRIDGNLILIRIGASHFLWKMVRRLVGSLVEVGRGRLDLEDFRRLLDNSKPGSRDYSVASHTAPPSGLFLERVFYDHKAEPCPITPAFPVRESQ